MRTIPLLFLVMAQLALASPPDHRPPDNRPPTRGTPDVTVSTGSPSSASDAVSTSGADASSQANATGGAASAEGGAATASNEGVNFSGGDTSFSSESTNINTVLVPNNNTAGCMRVYGFSFGNGDGAGALGVPFRDKACDYELAADDAAASGEHDIAWFWRCHKKHLYKPYRDKGESEEDAIEQCYQDMQRMLGFQDTATMIHEAEANFQMMAELSDEEAAELKAKIAALEAELAEREAAIEEYQEQQQQIQQQQQQQMQQNDELLDQLRRDAERRRKALAALEKKEA
jgi:hypothetical protein